MADDDYDADADMSGSLEVAYARIRDRVKAGGPGWIQKEVTMAEPAMAKNSAEPTTASVHYAPPALPGRGVHALVEQTHKTSEQLQKDLDLLRSQLAELRDKLVEHEKSQTRFYKG